MLDDIAIYIQMLLEQAQLTGNLDLIEEAIRQTQYVVDHFYSDEEKFFYFSNKNQTDLIIRKIDYYDSVIPSGNSVMFQNLHYLYLITANNKYLSLSEEMMKKVFSIATTYPSSFSNWLSVFLNYFKTINEVTYATQVLNPDNMLSIHRKFIPNLLVMPLFRENSNYAWTLRKKVEGAEKYYLCRNFSCLPPLNNLSELFGNIGE